MSVIRPFAAIRYATAVQRDLSARIAPPYDVLDAAGKAALLQRDPKNFVKIDLPHVPPSEAGPPTAYAEARRTLDAWLADGTMLHDRQPALYVYQQRYRHGDVEYVRKMFFAQLRLEPFGGGQVFPHEQTFGGPKQDRLNLMQATHANLSPIFGLYEDAENAVAQRLEKAIQAAGSEPLAFGTLDGVENRLWVATGHITIEDVVRLMASKPVYIADGHHRYGTAMLYRDWLGSQQGVLPPNHPANYVLCVFCAMEDPGLLILPTHRVLPGVVVKSDLLKNDPQIEITALDASGPDDATRALGRLGPQAVGLYNAAESKYFAVRPTKPDLLKDLEPGYGEAWRKLGLTFLHAYLFDRVVTPKLCADQAPQVQYIKAAVPAVEAARQGKGSVFLMQPTTMQELRAVCQSGDLMPQKSTFFYPKLASGLVVNPLTP